MIQALLICGVLAMSDGDSGRCDGQRLRIAGIDAPELTNTRCRQRPDTWACQPGPRRFAQASRDRARQLVRNGARCVETDRDQYRRIVARCTVNGRDLGSILVSEGLAVNEPGYGNHYAREEREARRARRGVWR